MKYFKFVKKAGMFCETETWINDKKERKQTQKWFKTIKNHEEGKEYHA